MPDYFLGIAGIAVSVGLFLIGYRQTVGAKKERVSAANAEIEKILVRRIVLEKYVPGRQDIARLIEGKARDFRVRPENLLSEVQILTSIFTRIVESDFIPAGDREEILNRMSPALVEAEKGPAFPVDLEEPRGEPKWPLLVSGLLAAVASMAGAIVATFPELSTVNVRLRELLPTALPVVVVSLTIIMTFIILARYKASQEEVTSRGAELSRYAHFEQEVGEALTKLGPNAVVRAASPDTGVDFIVEREGKRTLIEVKAWSRTPPIGFIKRLADRLRKVADNVGASEVIIVTQKPQITADKLVGETKVKIMTLRELRDYLREGK